IIVITLQHIPGYIRDNIIYQNLTNTIVNNYPNDSSVNNNNQNYNPYLTWQTEQFPVSDNFIQSSVINTSDFIIGDNNNDSVQHDTVNDYFIYTQMINNND